jgi:DNA polymerase-3 subunit delta
MQTLSPQALEEEWRKNKLRPVYYFCGAEQTLQQSALDLMKSLFKPEDLNFSSHCAETADLRAVTDLAQTAPMVGERRFIILKRCEKLKKDGTAEIAAYLSDPAPFTALFLISDKKGDSADPLARALGADCAQIFFEPLSDFEAARFLRRKFEEKNCPVTEDAAITLIELLGNDASTLTTEAEKISVYCHGSKEKFTPQNALELAGFSKEQDPFDLSKAICSRDSAWAAAVVDRLLASGAEPMAILYNISRTMERLIKVKKFEASGAGPSAPYQAGVTPGHYRHLAAATRSYTEDKLLRGLRRCLEIEALLKSSSGRDPGLLVRQLLYEILKLR